MFNIKMIKVLVQTIETPGKELPRITTDIVMSKTIKKAELASVLVELEMARNKLLSEYKHDWEVGHKHKE